MFRLWAILPVVLLTSCSQPLPLQIPTTTEGNSSSQLGVQTPTQPLQLSPTPPDDLQDDNMSISPTTSEPTILPSTPPPVVATIVPQTIEPQTGEQRWRAQQAQRETFEQPQNYIATAPVSLMWFDPLTGQSLEIGRLLGEFTAQARFLYGPNEVPALEVPYTINQNFGLTAISPAVVERMSSAGYMETVEAYVLQDDVIQPGN
ncbi:MAG: hypothetical protein AAGF95_03635 [Chloroflexota bacterium]